MSQNIMSIVAAMTWIGKGKVVVEHVTADQGMVFW